MDDIISGSYWTQAYCEKEKLDYEEQNESFFDLLQTAINAHCGEKIALYIHGDTVDSEFEENRVARLDAHRKSDIGFRKGGTAIYAGFPVCE